MGSPLKACYAGIISSRDATGIQQDTAGYSRDVASRCWIQRGRQGSRLPLNNAWIVQLRLRAKTEEDNGIIPPVDSLKAKACVYLICIEWIPPCHRSSRVQIENSLTSPEPIAPY